MTKSTQGNEPEPKKLNLYTLSLEAAQLTRLDAWCKEHHWESYLVDHARFAYRGNQVNIVGYKSGKVVIQGKKTEDFVTYVLEAEITQTPKLGYEEVNNPTWFEAHAGLDESGKGDLFGPLVTACVAADANIARLFIEKGVKDSKTITTDAGILRLDAEIRRTPGVVVKTTYAGMAKYNALYPKFGSNLNTLLAWMHSTSLTEALQEKRVPWGMLDQFSKSRLVERFFKDEAFDLRMQTKAEADPIVAAASIVARAVYIKEMEKLSEKAGEKLIRGASQAVSAQGARLIKKFGADHFGEFAKLHFRTACILLGLPVAERVPWQK